MTHRLLALALATISSSALATNYTTLTTNGGPGINGCTQQNNCTEESWGIDLNNNTGYQWQIDGGTGGASDLRLKLGALSGNRSMSLWVNNQKLTTIHVSSNEAPRGTGKEYGPFAATLNSGTNTVELRDTENSAEFDVFYLDASCPRPIEREWTGTYSGQQDASIDFVDQHKGAVVRFGGCSGTYLPGNLVLTAAHCFGNARDIDDPVAQSIALDQFIAQRQITFDYEHNKNGSLATSVSYPISKVVEFDLEGLDYAILEIDPSAAQLHPVARPTDNLPLNQGDSVIAINHSGGQRKSVSTGIFNGQYKDNSWYEAVDLDVIGGASGGSLLDDDGYVISVTAATGCDNVRYAAGGNSIHKLLEVSPALNTVFDSYEESYLQGYLNDFESGILWSNTHEIGKWSREQDGTNHFISSTNANSTNPAEIVSQPFYIDPNENPTIHFEFSTPTNAHSSLAVEVEEDGIWNNLWSAPATPINTWTSAEISIPGLLGSRKLRFKTNIDGVMLDNIVLPDTFKISSAFIDGYNHLEPANGEGKRLHTETGTLEVESGVPDGWWSAHWEFTLVEDRFIKITNRHTPNGVIKSLHTENWDMGFSEAPDGWWSAHWALEPVAGDTYAFRIRNRHKPWMYLYDSNGILDAGDIPSTDTKSHWVIKKH